MSALPSWGATPGIGAVSYTVENTVFWGGAKAPLLEEENAQIDSAAVDSGSSPTTVLRAGLILGQVASSGRLKAYSATATDGTQVPYGVLMRSLSMLDLNGVVENKFGRIMVAGPVKNGSLVGLDQYARRQMVQSGRFVFDDDLTGQAGFLALPYKEVAKTADYTVVAADNNTLFTNNAAAGAVTFTLPAIAAGYAFEFLVVTAQNVTVASAEGDNIVWDGDNAADSLTFSTASHIIGGHLLFYTNAAGTKWYVRQLGPSGCTVTVAT